MSGQEFDYSALDVPAWKKAVSPYILSFLITNERVVELYKKIASEYDFSYSEFVIGLITFTKTTGIVCDINGDYIPESVVAGDDTLKYLVSVGSKNSNRTAYIYHGAENFYIYMNMDDLYEEPGNGKAFSGPKFIGWLIDNFVEDMGALFWNISTEETRLSIFVEQYNKQLDEMLEKGVVIYGYSKIPPINFLTSDAQKTPYYDTAFQVSGGLLLYTNRAHIIQLGPYFERLYSHEGFKCTCKWVELASNLNGPLPLNIVETDCSNVPYNTKSLKVISLPEIHHAVLYMLLCINNGYNIDMEKCAGLAIEDFFAFIDNSPAAIAQLKKIM